MFFFLRCFLFFPSFKRGPSNWVRRLNLRWNSEVWDKKRILLFLLIFVERLIIKVLRHRGVILHLSRPFKSWAILLEASGAVEKNCLRPYSHNIFAHNIGIRRYCDIWHFLATDFYWTTKVSSYKNFVYLVLWFDKSLPWPIDIHGPKIFFYRNIVRQNVSCE